MTTSSQLTEAAARHSHRLASKLHADRAAGLAASQSAINEVADAELATLRKRIGAIGDARTAQLEAAAQAAEHTRRARAAALLSELFAPAPDSLASLVRAFRIDPTRVGAAAIRAVWDRFSHRALAEIGEELSTQVLGAALADDILGEPGMAGAVNYLHDHHFGSGQGVIEALGAATKVKACTQDVLDALITAERLMLATAIRHAGTMPEPDYAALHGLRRAHATPRDLLQARAELGEQQGARRTAEFERSYKAPTPFDALRARFASAGMLPPQ